MTGRFCSARVFIIFISFSNCVTCARASCVYTSASHSYTSLVYNPEVMSDSRWWVATGVMEVLCPLWSEIIFRKFTSLICTWNSVDHCTVQELQPLQLKDEEFLPLPHSSSLPSVLLVRLATLLFFRFCGVFVVELTERCAATITASGPELDLISVQHLQKKKELFCAERQRVSSSWWTRCSRSQLNSQMLQSWVVESKKKQVHMKVNVAAAVALISWEGDDTAAFYILFNHSLFPVALLWCSFISALLMTLNVNTDMKAAPLFDLQQL